MVITKNHPNHLPQAETTGRIRLEQCFKNKLVLSVYLYKDQKHFWTPHKPQN